MKKHLIISSVLITYILQLFSFPTLSYAYEETMPQIFQDALCNDKNFIEVIDEVTENDDYINCSAIEVEADSSTVLNNGDTETLNDNVSVIMYEDELHVPVRAMSDILDYEVNWDAETCEAYIQSEDDSVIITTTSDNTDRDDLQGILIDGITYAPVTDVASIADYQVTLSEDGTKAKLTDKFITKRLFIKLKNTDILTDNSFAEIFYGATELAINSDGLIFAVFNTESDTEKAYELLNGHPYVEYAEPDGLLSISFNSNYTWGTEYCNADYFALNNPVIQNNEEIITVAVIDSGLNAQDPIFDGRVIYDESVDDITDPLGHGTHVAGIIAAFTQSVADNVKICPYKIDAEEDGTFSLTTVSNMYTIISKASVHDIINMSFTVSPMSSFQTMTNVITNSSDTLFVAGAGNEKAEVSTDSLAHLVQSLNHGIAVTAIDKNGQPADFTNYSSSSSYYYIAAPGVNVKSTYYQSGVNYTYMNGTSQATPHVSGACAILFLMARFDITPDVVKNTLFSNYCITPDGWDSKYGRGTLYFSYKSSGTYAGFDWSFEGDTLTISGNGELPQTPDATALPWIFHKNFITKVSFSGDINGITRESLGNLPLVESIEISDDNTYYTSVSGALFSKDSKTLLYCPGIESGSELIVPDGTVNISDNAFKACKDLVSVVIPTSVTSIGKNAFADCVDLAHIYYIGSEEQWNAIEKLEDWDKNTGTETYEKVYELLCSYNAPTTVGVCGDSAIWKYWEIGGHLYIEGKGEMYDYDYVYDSGVIVENTAPWSEYKDYMLSLEIDNGITVIGARAFNSCGGFTDIVLPDTVTAIKAEAFDSELKNLTLSKNFADFNIDAFAKSSGLESISIPEENSHFSAKDGVLYNKDGSELCFYPNGLTNESFTFPDGVKKIGDGAFSRNYRLKYISFNDGLEEIGDNAFKGTTMYSLAALPESLKHIGISAFENCDNITLVSLPEGLSSIGERAFFSCDRLKEIYLPSSLKEIGGYVFSSCNYINKIYFNGTQEQWNAIQFADGWDAGIEDISITFNTQPTVSGSFGNNFTWSLNLSTGKLTINGNGEMTGFEDYSPPWEDYIENVSSVELTGGITNIKDYTFYEHKNIISVTLPESLEHIGKYAFHNCALLEKINLPDNLKIIDDYAFYKCAGLTEITLPKNLETIGSGAFTHCKFEKISIPEGVTSIGSYAFYGTAITSVVIPDKVSAIPEYTFAYCNKLTSVTIPKSVTSIDKYAFYCDYYLADIYYKGPQSGWSAISKNSTWNENAGAYTENRAPIIHYGEENHYTGTFGNNLTWTYWVDRKVLEIDGSGAMPDWTSAEETPWHSRSSYITSIVISEGITNIGDYAFYNLTAVSRIVLPSTITSIGSNAFYGCTALEEITLPENITTIGSSAFYGCSALKSISIPKGVTSIGSSAFSGCKVLSEVLLPETLTTIAGNTFYGCKALEEITIPEKVTSIGNYAFRDCTSLKNVTFAESSTDAQCLTTIGTGAFYNCSVLEEIIIPEKVTLIGDRAFCYCSALKAIDLPDSLTTINSYTFQNCTSLTEINIPQNVTTINMEAFFYCSSLETVTLPKSLTTINTHAFFHCSSLSDIYYMGNSVGWDKITKIYGWDNSAGTATESGTYTVHFAEANCVSGACGDNLSWKYSEEEKILEISGTGEMYDWSESSPSPWYDFSKHILTVIIGEGVTSIGDYSFYNCTALTEVSLPQSLTELGSCAFSKCSYLTNINYALNNVAWDAITKGDLWDNQAGTSTTNKTYAINYGTGNYYSGVCGDNLSWELREDDMILKITGTGAMYDWDSFTSAPWSDYLGIIKSVEIAEGVTTIGERAFYRTDTLTTATIPCSVTSIGNEAFGYCSYLSDIYYQGDSAGWNTITKSPYSWNISSGSLTENKTTKINYAVDTLYSGTCGDNLTWELWESKQILTIKGTGAMTEWSSESQVPWKSYTKLIKDIEISDGVTSIGNYAFKNCTYVTDIKIPKSVETIGKYAFSYCSKLTDVSLSEGLSAISDDAFYRCTSLTSVILPYGIESLGSYTFGYCDSLSSVTLPETLKNIGNYAFRKCTSLTSVKLPENLESLGNYAFYECTGLTDITMPKKITVVGDQTFRYCSALKTITISEGVTSIGNYVFESCSALESIYLPKSLKSLGANAFSITGLKDVYYAGSKNSWRDVSNYYDIKATVHYGEENSYTGTCGDNLTWTYWEERQLLEINGTGTMTSWTSYTKTPWYNYMSKIKKVELAKGVTSIGDYAFGNCSILTEAVIPESVTSIGEYAFLTCPALSTVYYKGSDADWNKVSVDSGNSVLSKAQIICGDNYVLLTADNVSVTLENVAEAVLAVASYDGEKLVDIQIITVTESCSLPLGEDGMALKYSNGNTIKAFLWNTEKFLSPWSKERETVVP